MKLHKAASLPDLQLAAARSLGLPEADAWERKGVVGVGGGHAILSASALQNPSMPGSFT